MGTRVECWPRVRATLEAMGCRGWRAAVAAVAGVLVMIDADTAVALTPRGSDRDLISGSSGLAGIAADVAMDADGDYVVVWSEDDYSSTHIKGKAFTVDGAMITEFSVATLGSAYNPKPRIAMDDSGDFVVVWRESGEVFYNLSFKTFSWDGASAPVGGSAIELSSVGAAVEDVPDFAVTMDSDGDFAVGWAEYEGYYYGVSNFKVEAFTKEGSPVAGSLTLVDQPASNSITGVDVAFDDDGDLFAVWDDGPNLNVNRIDGVVGGTPALATPATVPGVNYSGGFAIAADDDGDFAVVWEDAGSVQATLFDKADPSFATNRTLTVAPYVASTYVYTPSISMDGSGDFVASWFSYESGVPELKASTFDFGGDFGGVVAGGSYSTAPFAALSTTATYEDEDVNKPAAVAIDSDGSNVVVGWGINYFNSSHPPFASTPYDVSQVLARSLGNAHPEVVPPSSSTVVGSDLILALPMINDSEDGNVVASKLVITSLPSGGSLYKNGSVVAVVGTEILAGDSWYYQPPANAGSYSFGFRVADSQGVLSVNDAVANFEYSWPITVGAANTPPTAIVPSSTVSYGTDLYLNLPMIDDLEDGVVVASKLIITSLPSAGSLYKNGSLVTTVGTEIVAADSWYYQPPLSSGSYSFGFRVADSQGALSINSAAANFEERWPIEVGLHLLIPQNDSFALTAADFNADAPPASIVIESLPAVGELSYNGAPVSVGDTVDFSAPLIYAPPIGVVGSNQASFDFSSYDSGGALVASSSITFSFESAFAELPELDPTEVTSFAISGVESLGLTNGERDRAYRLVSLSQSVGGVSVYDQLVAAFGPYDATLWRVFGWDSTHDNGDGSFGRYVEGSAIPGIESVDGSFSGRALWLIVSQESSALEVDAPLESAEIVVTLQKGWNLVGYPFRTEMAIGTGMFVELAGSWVAMDSQNMVQTAIYALDVAAFMGGSGTYATSVKMSPYTGYWVYNYTEEPVNIKLVNPMF